MTVKDIQTAALAAFPDFPAVRTYYERGTILERLLGRYTVSVGSHSYKVNLRLTDYEQNSPSLASVSALPSMILSYIRARQSPILPDPKPFLVYDAVRKLEGILRKDMRVLEFGGGNSTIWFLDHGCDVVTVEHSKEWVKHIEYAVANRSGARSRLTLHAKQGQAALDVVRGMPERSFDLLLIDSMNAHTSRREAAGVGRSKVKPGGWIVLDNSDAPINWDAVELLGGKEREALTGFAYMTPYVSQTSFWRVPTPDGESRLRALESNR